MQFERLSGIPARSPRRFGNKRNASTVNVGLVGLGYWGPNLLRALFELEDVEVRYICDLDPERLGRYARAYPAPRATRDYHHVLSDRLLDRVALAPAASTRCQLASRPLRP